MKKFTKRESLNVLIAMLKEKNESDILARVPIGETEDFKEYAVSDALAYCENELALLDKKNAGDGKPTATQQANKILKSQILEWMTPGEKYTCSGFIKNCPACADLSGPKVSAMLTALSKAGLISRVVEKRIPYFVKE